ncbi:hydrogen peroxide-inducible genes activator [Thalassotalea mangrovi]|uniref:LysR family transcriptional regulator n=1 Tax=Thalassotalea mangrovi TaxID=2572245 RepID=A0A4U1B4B9_9GAMM|nr:hydrogen peroxide-inducible genes activator [Thalassotalea mangrovi]TKB44204.1 LysR family transcriptional regulator [Thalassotalea mangrovi]
MISLKQIHYALAVEKYLHFKNAADHCSVSQSALSTAINELEKQLGVAIFERDNKKVLVTELGKSILQQARKIKLDVDELQMLATMHKQPLSMPMSIGVIPTIAPYLLPKVLPGVRRAYPESQLKIVEDKSNVLVDMVRRGELDTAILALPFPHEGLIAFEFWQEDFYWITHKDDALAKRSQIRSDEMDVSHLLLLKDGHCLKEHALAACHLPESQNDSNFSATSLTTLVQMVAGKLGSTLVPEMALDALVNNSSELSAVHLDEPGPHRTLAFLIRPNYVGTANIESLIKQIQTQLKH